MDQGSFFHPAIHDTDKNDHASVWIIKGVKDQCFQRFVGISARSRDPVYDLFQHLIHIQPCLGRDLRCILCLNTDHVLDLVDHTLRIGTWKVDLVDNGKYIQVVIQCQIYIGQCLGFDPLCCIHYKDRSVTGSQTSGNLIVKVYVSRGIDQVKNIFLPVFCTINGTDCLGFDGDPTLPFQFHVVQHLLLHLSLGEKASHLNDRVSRCGFSMVDMRDNTKISDFTLVHCHLISS